jgi:hypothetical protein
VSRHRPTAEERGGLAWQCESCRAGVGTWCRTRTHHWATYLHGPRTNRYWAARKAEPARLRVHAIIYDLIVDHPMWIGDDGQGLDYLPERETRIGDFCDQLTDKFLDYLGVDR